MPDRVIPCAFRNVTVKLSYMAASVPSAIPISRLIISWRCIFLNWGGGIGVWVRLLWCLLKLQSLVSQPTFRILKWYNAVYSYICFKRFSFNSNECLEIRRDMIWHKQQKQQQQHQQTQSCIDGTSLKIPFLIPLFFLKFFCHLLSRPSIRTLSLTRRYIGTWSFPLLPLEALIAPFKLYA